MRILGISGSIRRGSYNTRLLHAAGRELPPDGELEVFEGLADVPPYNADEDVGSGPAAVERLRDAIAGADALLISTPEYNASVPGVLKNAIDWASRPFPDNALQRKPVAVIGATTGMFGAVWAQAELRKVLSAAGAAVVEQELGVPHADQAFDGDGQLEDPELRERLRDLVHDLAHETVSLALAA